MEILWRWPRAKRSLIRRSSVPLPFQDLVNGTLCDIRNPSNISLSTPFMREPHNEFTWNMAWHCLNFGKFRPESRFNRCDSSEFNPIYPFSWPTILTSNESVHSKLREMYLHGNSLPKSIQITSRNWGHMFRNQLQTIQSILLPVKRKSPSKEKCSNEFTGVKQCTFQWLISNDIAHREMVFNCLVIHHLIMMACISY